MKSIETLRNEHNAVLFVLDSLGPALTAAEQGVPVPADIFTDVGRFFSIFVEQCHNGKEEGAVFARMPASSTTTALTHQLEQEHENGKRLSAAYAAAVEKYTPGDIASAAEVAKAARAYGVALRAHIDEETSGLFTSMQESLSGEDDAMTAEFDRIELEEIGAGVHEEIHAMIDGLPPRIKPWADKAKVEA
jgi:hemerythrin-like domain-containing protein